jgi:hypothetical protein
MSNVDSPNGLWPRRYLNGAPWTGKASRYYIPSSDSGGNYGLGDLVKIAGSADANGVMSVTGNVSAHDAVIGVIVAVEPVTADSLVYRADDTERYVFVADDPQLLFSVQEDSAGNALTADSVGSNCDLIGFHTPSTVTGYSTVELDSDTAAGTATLDVLIYGLDRTPGNAIGTNARWLVRLNNHQLVDGVTGTSE